MTYMFNPDAGSKTSNVGMADQATDGEQPFGADDMGGHEGMGR